MVALLAAVSLAAIPARAGMLSPEDQHIYRQAFAAANEDKFDYARALAGKASNKLLVKVLQWMDYIRPNSGATFEQITAFIRANPTWPQISTLIRRAEEAITAATPMAPLREWFAIYPPQTADGAIAFGRALMAAGETAQATDILRRTWVEGALGPVQEREFLTHFGNLLRPEDDAARLDRLLWDHQDEAATAQMKRVDDGLRQVARARIALSRDSSHGELLAAGVPEKYRDDPGLLYELVRYRRDRGYDDQAIALLKRPGADKGRPDLWWSERAILARRALQEGRISIAYDLASNHGVIDGQPYAEAEWLSGWIALRFLHDRREALDHFARMYDHVVLPSSHARAAYWAGRAAEELGDHATAGDWYAKAAKSITTFYGQLAAARTGADDAWLLPADPLPTAEDIAAFEKHELVRAARMLGEIGETEMVRPFMLRMTEIGLTPGQCALAAGLAASLGRSDIAVLVARHSEKEGVPLITSGYPIPAVQVGERPERALVFGLIRQESAFHFEAVSSAGARGLMQLMPATAEKLARALKLVFKRKNTLDVALTRDPSLNVRLGTTYLGDLLNEFNGSYVLAIAAYNAGPARVRKWLHDLGDPRSADVDVIDWIESIPFSETRNYVERVLEGVQVYRHRLGTTGLALSLEGDLKR